MKIGFGRKDITPRLGVELAGYMGYLNRYATAVRAPLYARSIAVSDGRQTAVIVSCDLVFVTKQLVAEVRRLINKANGVAPSAILIHAIHTHSGPSIRVDYRNAYDPPYMALLPRRLAAAGIDAVNSLIEAELHHACVPCEGMGTNRVYDTFNYGLAALEPGFRPAKPELTDTSCHVIKAVANGRMIGFVSCFGCHNVVGGGKSTYLHGDYAGIATQHIERENPGSIGLFLQGAEGDVNTAGCCFGNRDILKALDVIAGRYATALRNGLQQTRPISADVVRVKQQSIRFSRLKIPLTELRERLAAEEAIVKQPDADDNDQAFRWSVLRSEALRDIIERIERGESFENETELQGIRFGPVTLLGAPLEIFQRIKNDIVSQAQAPIPLVLSLCNDEQGYAPDSQTAQNTEDYAARVVPLWKYTLPYADIHSELVGALLKIDADLTR